MALPDVTAAALRAYVRWADAVPSDFLDRHLSGATRDVGHALGGDVPADFEADAAEAITALAAASALPFVHTFALDGAAAAVRSVQLTSNRPHFLGADDQSKTVARLRARADELLARILAAREQTRQGDTFVSSGLFMGAI